MKENEASTKIKNIIAKTEYFFDRTPPPPKEGQGRQTGGGGVGLNPSRILDGGGGVEHMSTPPDFEKNFLGGVVSP